MTCDRDSVGERRFLRSSVCVIEHGRCGSLIEAVNSFPSLHNAFMRFMTMAHSI